MTNHNQFIRCLENIQDLSLQKKYNYALLLCGGLIRSKKTIKYNPETSLYYVRHHVDNSKETFTEAQLKKTLLFKAIKFRSLIAIID